MRLRTAILSGLMAGTLGTALPMAATPAYAQSYADQNAVIRAFRSTLGRNPSSSELRRYAVMVDRYGWSESDVRRDISSRTDYRRYSTTRFDVDTVIRRAYLDILGREPDGSGLRSYRQNILREGWTEWDLRQALRQSPEYRGGGSFRTASADRIIVRAYRDILGRNPDQAGLNAYRRAIIEEGWDEHDVRQALRTSDERRDVRRVTRYTTNRSGAYEMVRRAYRNVLGREVDTAGLNDYSQRVMRDGWSQADIERALRESPEYRMRYRR